MTPKPCHSICMSRPLCVHCFDREGHKLVLRQMVCSDKSSHILHQRSQALTMSNSNVIMKLHHVCIRKNSNNLPTQQVRITAGPGSGKTRVVASRVAWLLQNGVPARSILLITFTNKAAKELKVRISAAVGLEASARVSSGTFHSVCARILRWV